MSNSKEITAEILIETTDYIIFIYQNELQVINKKYKKYKKTLDMISGAWYYIGEQQRMGCDPTEISYCPHCYSNSEIMDDCFVYCENDCSENMEDERVTRKYLDSMSDKAKIVWEERHLWKWENRYSHFDPNFGEHR